MINSSTCRNNQKSVRGTFFGLRCPYSTLSSGCYDTSLPSNGANRWRTISLLRCARQKAATHSWLNTCAIYIGTGCILLIILVVWAVVKVFSIGIVLIGRTGIAEAAGGTPPLQGRGRDPGAPGLCAPIWRWERGEIVRAVAMVRVLGFGRGILLFRLLLRCRVFRRRPRGRPRRVVRRGCRRLVLCRRGRLRA